VSVHFIAFGLKNKKAPEGQTAPSGAKSRELCFDKKPSFAHLLSLLGLPNKENEGENETKEQQDRGGPDHTQNGITI
jgi:hypothetical protein